MKIVCWNINGIRAASKKNFRQFLDRENPDVLCIQEAKAKMNVLKPEDYSLRGYKLYWAEGVKPGYSGVATWVREDLEVLSVKIGIGVDKFDHEGRTVVVELKDFFIINSYYPNGRDDLSRVPFKLEYSYKILEVARLLEQTKAVILAGDFNTAHHPIDLARPEANKNSTGFLPIERNFLDDLKVHGFQDAFRVLHGETKDVYSYWSYRGGAKLRNVGWRIDYFWVSRNLVSKIKQMTYYPEDNSSDHCPLVLVLED